MIGYIEGKLLQKKEDRITVLAGQVGYEVMVPAFVMDTLQALAAGEQVALHIYYHQTERQPKPMLIGFNREVEKEFFQKFISVGDIGPLKAVKAMNLSVRELARAIESKDAARLKQLKGIGSRTAQKIIAALEGKVDKFALIREGEKAAPAVSEDLTEQVRTILVEQLGHRGGDARKMVAAAMKRNRSITTAEALLEEVYRGEKEA